MKSNLPVWLNHELFSPSSNYVLLCFARGGIKWGLLLEACQPGTTSQVNISNLQCPVGV